MAVVLPCYRESDSILPAIQALSAVLNDLVAENKLDKDWCVCFVDDGSDDDTWTAIQTAQATESRILGIRLVANAGQQAALLAGLSLLADEFDLFVTMDVDLQDDPGALPAMLDSMENGFEIAYGVRNRRRRADSPFKRWSADLYYRTLRLLGIQVIPHHADYRMFRAEVLNVLLKHPHAHLFLRAVYPRLGFRGKEIPYVRQPRYHGTTKYNLWKMLGLAIDGLTLFTAAPLKIILFVGLAGLMLFLGLTAWILVLKFHHTNVPEWLTTTLPILFFGALQSIALSLIGEYLRRIYLENHRFPNYSVRSMTGSVPNRKTALWKSRKQTEYHIPES